MHAAQQPSKPVWCQSSKPPCGSPAWQHRQQERCPQPACRRSSPWAGRPRGRRELSRQPPHQQPSPGRQQPPRSERSAPRGRLRAAHPPLAPQPWRREPECELPCPRPVSAPPGGWHPARWQDQAAEHQCAAELLSNDLEPQLGRLVARHEARQPCTLADLAQSRAAEHSEGSAASSGLA